jgi:hypothetical protein
VPGNQLNKISKGRMNMLSVKQKQLILEVLKKEKRRIFSTHKGELLNKTIEDLSQNIRNETMNPMKNRL